MNSNTILLVAGVALLGVALGYFSRIWFAVRRGGSLESKAEERIQKAESKAKEIVLEAKDRAAAVVSDAQKEEKERKQELRRLEEHLLKKETALERHEEEVRALEEKKKKELEELKKTEEEIHSTRERAISELEKISGYSKDEAKNQIFKEVEESSRKDLAEKMAHLEHENREKIEEKGLEVIVSSLQRYARNSIADIK